MKKPQIIIIENRTFLTNRFLIIFQVQNPVKANLICSTINHYKYLSVVMKFFIILAFLCMLAVQQTVLLSSSTSNTIITNPSSSSIAVETYHTTNNPNYIGYGAQWLWKSGSSSWPSNDETQFQSVFYADCTASAVLYITADNLFYASLNGGATFTGNDWKKVYKFALKGLRCGKNVLTITGVNLDAYSPAAVIFAVVQDQSSCYACKSPLSFYNYDTCQCECLQSCDCARINDNYVFVPYPTCGCKCKTSSICFNPNFYWNDNLCTCVCKPIACLPGYTQNPGSCLCEKKSCVENISCINGKVWSPTLCRCVCKKPISCIYPLVWNENTCSCQSVKSDTTTSLEIDNSVPPA